MSTDGVPGAGAKAIAAADWGHSTGAVLILVIQEVGILGAVVRSLAILPMVPTWGVARSHPLVI